MVRLDIFVSEHCSTCQEAHRLAKAVAARFPDLSVRLIDLDSEPEARPDHVIAVPTYLLDGAVISLGNPRQSDLFQRIEVATAAAESCSMARRE